MISELSLGTDGGLFRQVWYFVFIAYTRTVCANSIYVNSDVLFSAL
jgi:hypothetical protein